MEVETTDSWDPSGTTAVISGAASGFGRKLALLCRAAGMRLVLADVARFTLDAVLQRRFYVLPHRGAAIGLEHRLRDFLAGGAPNNPLKGAS